MALGHFQAEASWGHWRPCSLFCTEMGAGSDKRQGARGELRPPAARMQVAPASHCGQRHGEGRATPALRTLSTQRPEQQGGLGQRFGSHGGHLDILGSCARFSLFLSHVVSQSHDLDTQTCFALRVRRAEHTHVSVEEAHIDLQS